MPPSRQRRESVPPVPQFARPEGPADDLTTPHPDARPIDPTSPTSPQPDDLPHPEALSRPSLLERGRSFVTGSDRDGLDDPTTPTTDRLSRRTPGSTEPLGDPVQAGRAIAGLLRIIAAAVGALLARQGARLRQPQTDELDDVSQPLGRIAARHVPVDVFAPDLIDLGLAAGAFGAYAQNGPLLTPLHDLPPDDDTTGV